MEKSLIGTMTEYTWDTRSMFRIIQNDTISTCYIDSLLSQEFLLDIIMLLYMQNELIIGCQNQYQKNLTKKQAPIVVITYKHNY